MNQQLDRPGVFRSHRVVATELEIACAKGPVLEIGAGDYSFRYLMEKHADLSSWTTLDFAPPCDVVADIDSDSVVLPFGDHAFGLVICTEVLEHLRWPQCLLREVARVLRPGGAVVASVPNIASLSYRFAWMLGLLPSCAASGNLPAGFGGVVYEDKADGSLRGGHVIDFNRARIEQLLQATGFRVDRVRGSGLIWHRQVLPHGLVPASLASNIICRASTAMTTA